MNAYDLVVLDVDGTLVEPASGNTFRQIAADWRLLPNRVERLADLRRQGVCLALASNQGGVAFGYLDRDEIEREIARLAALIVAVAYRVCPFHPEGTIPAWAKDSPDRKPAPGMLLSILEELRIPASRACMVGDRDEDELAARAAKVVYCPAELFFDPTVSGFGCDD